LEKLPDRKSSAPKHVQPTHVIAIIKIFSRHSEMREEIEMGREIVAINFFAIKISTEIKKA
jgi:hypothetical protein